MRPAKARRELWGTRNRYLWQRDLGGGGGESTELFFRAGSYLWLWGDQGERLCGIPIGQQHGRGAVMGKAPSPVPSHTDPCPADGTALSTGHTSCSQGHGSASSEDF